ncbi:MAG: transcription termination/antitermination NusG family protein [Planctomycetota bacterium]
MPHDSLHCDRAPVPKPSNNPPITPVAGEDRSVFDLADQSPWAVAYTRPRQEKALARDLIQRGVNFFLPMVQRTTLSGGRRRRSLCALFPSYLFFESSDQGRLSLYKTARVVDVVSPSRVDQRRFRRELQSIEKAVLACPDKIELAPRVTPGASVRVRAGALRDIEGTVVARDDVTKVSLKVSALGTSVLMEIDADLLEPCG